MIPTIEDILNGLLDGEYTLNKAINLVNSHIDSIELRDYFAAKAMQSLMADSGWRTDHMEATARLSYQMADAMLKERSK